MAGVLPLVPRGGDQAIFLIDDDPQLIIPATLTTPAKWDTSRVWNPIIAGYANIPEVTDEANTKAGHGIGHFDPLYFARGRREFTISEEFRIADPTFLLRGIRQVSPGEFDGLDPFACIVGFSDYLGNGVLELYRKCVIDEMTLNFQDGSAQEITATVRIFAQGKDTSLANQDQSAYDSPTIELLSAAGSPLTWHNTIQAILNTDSIRDIVSNIKITVNNNVERKTSFPIVASTADQAAKDLALCCETFLARTRTVKVDITLHTPLDASQYENFALGALVVTARPGFLTYNPAGMAWTITIPNNAFKSTMQKGGEPGTQMSFTQDLVSSGIDMTWA